MVELVHITKYQCPTNATYSTPSPLPVTHTSHSPLGGDDIIPIPVTTI